MKTILALLAVGTLVMTGCQTSTRIYTYETWDGYHDDHTGINYKAGVDHSEVTTEQPNDHTGIDYRTGMDSYEVPTGYTYPLGPPSDSLNAEY